MARAISLRNDLFRRHVRGLLLVGKIYPVSTVTTLLGPMLQFQHQHSRIMSPTYQTVIPYHTQR